MQLFQTLDGDVYERMQEYFTLFCQSELHSCGVTQELFMKILSDATKVDISISLTNTHSRCFGDVMVMMIGRSSVQFLVGSLSSGYFLDG